MTLRAGKAGELSQSRQFLRRWLGVLTLEAPRAAATARVQLVEAGAKKKRYKTTRARGMGLGPRARSSRPAGGTRPYLKGRTQQPIARFNGNGSLTIPLLNVASYVPVESRGARSGHRTLRRPPLAGSRLRQPLLQRLCRHLRCSDLLVRAGDDADRPSPRNKVVRLGGGALQTTDEDPTTVPRRTPLDPVSGGGPDGCQHDEFGG